jgi:electron transport complex protein RnfG
MSEMNKSMLRAAVVLGIFAIVATAMVAYTNSATRERIINAKREYTLRKLNELVPPPLHDKELDKDSLQINDPLLDKSASVTVYRAQKDNQVVAVIMQCVAPDGYSGRITLLVAIDRTGKVMGVRATEHKETPGLGDAIDTSKSDWIYRFKDKSLQNPAETHWRVRRDNGDFDQITSATITSRAVVKTTYNALRYFEAHRDTLLKTP